MNELNQPIITTEKINFKLNELGIKTYWDLLLHIPIRYEDLTKIYHISNAVIGSMALVEGKVLSAIVIKKNVQQLQVKIQDNTGIITLIFFNFYPNYATQYKVGKVIRAYGEIKADFFGGKTIIHPKIQTVIDDNVNLSSTFTPIYRLVKGLTQVQITKLIDEAFNKLHIPEILPQLYQSKYISMDQALRTLHKLKPYQFKDGVHIKALERLKLDEILTQQIIMRNIYNLKHNQAAISLKLANKVVNDFIKTLPFSLTNAQEKVIYEIYQDLSSNQQMNRLLQGDVGSGKTIVATISMLPALLNSYQVCILAPTEILAEQHYNKIKQFLSTVNTNVIWLAGSLTQKEKSLAYESISSGEAKVIIGTHAVFQKKVIFKNLALIIVDEQHKFGVKQRLYLQNKSEAPHQLMMSATPIPRSLAMSYYADFDVSVIDELPPNRKPIKTTLINNNRRGEVINFIHEQIKKNSQAYWVCPLIEESETLNLAHVESVYAELSNKLPNIKIGILHGKLKSKDKAQIMQEFLLNQIQLLIATTVIEVGVDVPNACIMVIEHSERMGLAQLHQLRGRVGRGTLDSTCVLLYQNPLGEVAKKRLKAIYENTDGFKIAHQDMLIRGPGEILGDRQSGVPILKFANLEDDINLIPLAKQLAQEIIKNTPKLANDYIKLWYHSYESYIKV